MSGIDYFIHNTVKISGIGDLWLGDKQRQQDRLERKAQYQEDRKFIRGKANDVMVSGEPLVIGAPFLIKILDDAESWIAEQDEPECPPEVPDFAIRVPGGTRKVLFIDHYGAVEQVDWNE